MTCIIQKQLLKLPIYKFLKKNGQFIIRIFFLLISIVDFKSTHCQVPNMIRLTKCYYQGCGKQYILNNFCW